MLKNKGKTALISYAVLAIAVLSIAFLGTPKSAEASFANHYDGGLFNPLNVIDPFGWGGGSDHPDVTYTNSFNNNYNSNFNGFGYGSGYGGGSYGYNYDYYDYGSSGYGHGNGCNNCYDYDYYWVRPPEAPSYYHVNSQIPPVQPRVPVEIPYPQPCGHNPCGGDYYHYNNNNYYYESRPRVIIQETPPIIVKQQQPVIVQPVYPNRLSLTCSLDSTVVQDNKFVTWTANVFGGLAPYKYIWSGTEYPATENNTGTIYVYYKTYGYKDMAVSVKSADGQTATVVCAQVNIIDP